MYPISSLSEKMGSVAQVSSFNTFYCRGEKIKHNAKEDIRKEENLAQINVQEENTQHVSHMTLNDKGKQEPSQRKGQKS